jgi:acetyl esterase/lipase
VVRLISGLFYSRMSRRDSLRLDWRRDNVRFLRTQYERACRVVPEGIHEWRTLDLSGGRMRVLIHNGHVRADRVIVYFHGGGWIVGSPATHAGISGALAAAIGLPVISLDYRLAPEFSSCAAIADGNAVLHHFVGTGAGQYTSAVLCGDSAGGALALAVEHRAAKLQGTIAGVASFYGCFGLAANPALHRASYFSDGLDAACVRRYWLATNRSFGQSPFSIASLAHGDGCPVHLLVAGRDPLRHDSIALARALGRTGRSVTLDVHPFEDHSFLQNARAHRAKETAYRKFADWAAGLQR